MTYDFHTVTSTDLNYLAWQIFTCPPGKSSLRLRSGPLPAPAPGSVCPVSHGYPPAGNQIPTSATEGLGPVLQCRKWSPAVCTASGFLCCEICAHGRVDLWLVLVFRRAVFVCTRLARWVRSSTATGAARTATGTSSHMAALGAPRRPVLAVCVQGWARPGARRASVPAGTQWVLQTGRPRGASVPRGEVALRGLWAASPRTLPECTFSLWPPTPADVLGRAAQVLPYPARGRVQQLGTEGQRLPAPPASTQRDGLQLGPVR